jgi:hypothetical protein
LRSIQTGQNCIVPESSLPQLGQVRWNSVLIVLAALQLHAQPRARPGSAERREIGQHGPLVNYCPIPQAIACSPILACQMTFRNKIPAARVLRRPLLITTFDERRLEIKTANRQLSMSQ